MPNPLAQGAVAASTVATLRQFLAQAGLPVGDLRVEMGTLGPKAKNQSQAYAAEGRIRYRQSIRRVIVPGSPATVPLELVRAALLHDSLSRAVREGSVLLSDEVEVV